MNREAQWLSIPSQGSWRVSQKKSCDHYNEHLPSKNRRGDSQEATGVAGARGEHQGSRVGWGHLRHSICWEETTRQLAVWGTWLVIEGVVLKECASFPFWAFRGKEWPEKGHRHWEGVWREGVGFLEDGQGSCHLCLSSGTFLLGCRKEDGSCVLRLTPGSPPILPAEPRRGTGSSQLCPPWKKKTRELAARRPLAPSGPLLPSFLPSIVLVWHSSLRRPGSGWLELPILLPPLPKCGVSSRALQACATESQPQPLSLL